MDSLSVKIKGQAVPGGADSTLISIEEIANELHQRNISPGNAPQFIYPIITQEFVDKYGFVAKYHSGTFLGYYLENEDGDDYYAEIFTQLKLAHDKKSPKSEP